MFTLKKIAGCLLLPLPLLLLLMATGLLLLWSGRWQKSGKIIISLSWLILLLLSLQPVADSLLAPLEQRYPTWHQSRPVRYVVVLGGSYTWNPAWAPGSNLYNNSLARVIEGIRLWRNNNGTKLIFTGAAFKNNSKSSAAVAAVVAESLGVPASDIITLDTPRDTNEEATAVAEHIGRAPFLLVTSASHLPRAMIFFKKKGLTPIPAPANQLAMSTPLHPWQRLIPSSAWLTHSTQAWYEIAGLLWQQIIIRDSNTTPPAQK